jgi:hypothetical protein
VKLKVFIADFITVASLRVNPAAQQGKSCKFDINFNTRKFIAENAK